MLPDGRRHHFYSRAEIAAEREQYASDIGCEIRLVLQAPGDTTTALRAEISQWFAETFPHKWPEPERYVLLDLYNDEILIRDTADAVYARLRWGEVLKTA